MADRAPARSEPACERRSNRPEARTNLRRTTRETAIISGCGESSGKRFTELWDRYHDMVFKRSLALLGGNRDDAEEAYGRVAILALEKCPPSFNDTDHGKAWLLTITRNVCMDLHRERRRLREVSFDARSREDRAVERIAVTDATPERAYLNGERAETLRLALSQLPQRLRRTAELHLIREMSYRDIARELCVSEVNVRKRMQHTREVMRAMVGSLRHVAPAPPEEEMSIEQPHRASTAAHVQVHTATGLERETTLILGFRNARRDSRSMARLTRYIESYPTGWKNRLQLARLMVAAGSLPEAIPHYRFVIGKQPFLAEVWVELGKLLEALDRTSEAAEVFAKGAATVGREADRLQLRGLSEAARGERDAARRSLTQSTAANPAQAEPWRELGALLLRNGRPADAIGALDRCIAADAGDTLAIALRHDALMLCGRARAAFESLHSSTDPLLVERRLFHRLRAGARENETRPLLRALQRFAAERAAAAAADARLVASRGRLEEAVGMMDVYTRRHPSNPCGWLHTASLLRHVGRTDAALQPIERALSLEPDRPDLWLEACGVGRMIGGPAGERILAEVRRRFPDHAILLGASGTLAAALGRFDEGDALSLAAIELQPSLGVLRVQRGALLAMRGNFGEAIEELLRARSLLPPDDARAEARSAAATLARCHRALGDEQSGRHWEAFASFRPAGATP